MLCAAVPSFPLGSLQDGNAAAYSSEGSVDASDLRQPPLRL